MSFWIYFKKCKLHSVIFYHFSTLTRSRLLASFLLDNKRRFIIRSRYHDLLMAWRRNEPGHQQPWYRPGSHLDRHACSKAMCFLLVSQTGKRDWFTDLAASKSSSEKITILIITQLSFAAMANQALARRSSWTYIPIYRTLWLRPSVKGMRHRPPSYKTSGNFSLDYLVSGYLDYHHDVITIMTSFSSQQSMGKNGCCWCFPKSVSHSIITFGFVFFCYVVTSGRNVFEMWLWYFFPSDKGYYFFVLCQLFFF